MTEPADRDRGLQAERTGLAWTRTGSALGVNGFLLVTRALIPVPAGHTGAALSWGMALAVGFATVVVVAIGCARRRALVATSPPSLASRTQIRTTGITVLLATVFSTAAMITG